MILKSEAEDVILKSEAEYVILKREPEDVILKRELEDVILKSEAEEVILMSEAHVHILFFPVEISVSLSAARSTVFLLASWITEEAAGGLGFLNRIGSTSISFTSLPRHFFNMEVEGQSTNSISSCHLHKYSCCKKITSQLIGAIIRAGKIAAGVSHFRISSIAV